MTAEVPGKESDYVSSEAELLETLLFTTLEEHNGLCLDNELERLQLAAILAQALITVGRDRAINFELLLTGLDQPGSRSQTVGSTPSTLPPK